MPEDKVQQEILSRVRRIETRFMRMAELMGLDPSHKVRPVWDASSNTLRMDALDVSLGNVLDILAKQGISHPVRLEVQGMVVALISRGV